jgi:hypothetical protein
MYLSIIGRWYWRPRKAHVHDVDCLGIIILIGSLVHAVFATIVAVLVVTRIQLLVL